MMPRRFAMVLPGFGVLASCPCALARLIQDMERAAAICAEAATRE